MEIWKKNYPTVTHEIIQREPSEVFEVDFGVAGDKYYLDEEGVLFKKDWDGSHFVEADIKTLICLINERGRQIVTNRPDEKQLQVLRVLRDFFGMNWVASNEKGRLFAFKNEPVFIGDSWVRKGTDVAGWMDVSTDYYEVQRMAEVIGKNAINITDTLSRFDARRTVK